MPHFAGPCVLATVESAVDDDAAADPGADRQVEHVCAPIPGAEAVLGERRGIGIVCDACWNTEGRLAGLGQRVRLPAGDVHGQAHRAPICLDRPSERDAHCSNGSAVIGTQLLPEFDHALHTRSCPARGRGCTE